MGGFRVVKGDVLTGAQLDVHNMTYKRTVPDVHPHLQVEDVPGADTHINVVEQAPAQFQPDIQPV